MWIIIEQKIIAGINYEILGLNLFENFFFFNFFNFFNFFFR